ncbi:MAG: SDR family oxidoreductase [Chloroflexi bacterium]|nr:MAG: SDR family oxidoreductase [Chloroflexota bacterium]
MELTGKVALVTGAGSGIGKATTVLLAKQGARVAALSHTADEIQATAEETITNNLTGTFLTSKYAVPHLKKRGGSIIITSSVNGTRVFSNTGAIAYSTTKAGQVAMTKMLAVELAPHNVRVNVICPGATQTEISENTQQRDVEKIKFPVEYPKGRIPLGDGKPATAEDVGQLVLFLASDAANQITGTEVWIDGGSSLVTG